MEPILFTNVDKTWVRKNHLFLSKCLYNQINWVSKMYCGAKRWQRIYLRVFSRGEKSYGAGQTLYKNVSANKMKIQELIKESARTQMPAHSEIAYKHLPQMLASKVEGSQIKLFAFKYSNILLDFIF